MSPQPLHVQLGATAAYADCWGWPTLLGASQADLYRHARNSSYEQQGVRLALQRHQFCVGYVQALESVRAHSAALEPYL